MANKLKDVFSEKETLMSGTVNFIDKKAESNFIDALKTVYKTGEAVHVEGVKSVLMGIESGSQQFPYKRIEGNITDFVVGPTYENKNYPLIIDGETIDFPLLYCRIEDGIIIRTATEEIVFVQLAISFANNKTKVEIIPHFEKASSIQEIIFSIKKTEQFLEKFFAQEANDMNEEYVSIMKHIKQTRFIYEMVQYVEINYSTHFDISVIDLSNGNSILDLYELYMVSKNGNPIRMNAKLTETESTNMEVRGEYNGNIGHAIYLSFHGELEYSIWNKTIKLQSINLLCNAIIKDVIALENGHTKVIYGDTEQKPMFVSYKAYRTREEANEEMKHMMEHKEDYENAKTAKQYWEQEIQAL